MSDDEIWPVQDVSFTAIKQDQAHVEEHTRKLKEYKSLERNIREQRARLKHYTGLSRGSQNFMEQQEILEDLERKLIQIDNNLYKSAPEFWRIKKNISFANKPKGGRRRTAHLRKLRRRAAALRRRTMRRALR